MGSPKKVAPQPVDPLRPEFRGLSSDLGSYARSLVGRGATPYSGEFTAGITDPELDILNRINSQSFNPYTPGDGASMPTLTDVSFGPQRNMLISDILSGRRLSPTSNPYLDEVIGSITRRSNEALGGNLNLIDAAFARSGMTGRSSGRSGEAIEASRRIGTDLSGQIANILGANYQQGLNEQANVLGSVLPRMDDANLARFTAQGNLALQSRQLLIDQLMSALGANALPRMIGQQDMAARYQEFLRMLNEPIQYTQLASQILAGQPGMGAMAPTYAPMPFWQQALLGGIQGGAQGAATALML